MSMGSSNGYTLLRIAIHDIIGLEFFR